MSLFKYWKVRMPGAAAVVRDSRSRRNGGGGKRQVPKRSSSSAAALQRSKSPGRAASSSTGDDVVATGYTQFNADLPPLDAPVIVPRTKGHHAKEKKKERPSSVIIPSSSSSSSTSDRQVRFLQDHGGCENTRGSPSPLGSSSASSSGVSSASSSPPMEKARSPNKRSVSMKHHLQRRHRHHRRLSPEGRASSANSSSTSLSPGVSEISLNEDDVTCAICLDLLHRPRSLPCGHTFCSICLQNYANSCRMIITCPSCRGAAQVPKEGVVGLPLNAPLEEMAQIIKGRRLGKGKYICGICNGTTDVLECGHCNAMFCRGCGAPHLKQVRTEVEELRQLLVAARDTFSCRVEEDETRFRRLEETIEEVVEDRVAKLHEEGRKLQAQVQDMRKDSQKRSESLSQDIDKALGSSSSQTEEQQMEWEKLNQLHASLRRLLKATSNAKGPRVTLDEASLSLSTSSLIAAEDTEAKEEDDEDRPLTSQDHSLHYRIKGTLSRMRWGQHLGERPAGLAVNPNNSDIFVTGSDTCRIFVFDSSGRQIGGFGSRGHNDGQFLCPIGIAFSQVSNEVLITDKWKHCIHVFDTDGKFIRQLGRKGKGYGHFSSPEGIATDRHGRIYVADTCNHRVQILDSDGVFLREVGVVSSETLGDGQRYTKSEFNEPTGVAASLDGSKVYVADAGNHRIKVFNGLTGERELMFGSRGKHKGQFESPESIVVDAEGFMLIGDSGNGRVQVFRPNGNFVRFLGSRGNNHGEFGWVSGVALSKSFDIVVTDFKNNLVAVF
ncbi:tripartite motif-containing protein 2-like isoform X3 [Macrobrachium rosenbergii]|uniref:tripartite motif-containing protein 2-like isoform X3 n=1 Tax=Macrobrachium rosenbergii TaxID=79674 RepID=UPI0034D63DFC